MYLKDELKKEQRRIERRRIKISSKRQITIPVKYYEKLGLDKELDCLFTDDMLILRPIHPDESAFSEQILADLIQQGFTGEQLLSEFTKISRKIRPAVDKLIEEADRIAEAASVNYMDRTDDVFSNETSKE